MCLDVYAMHKVSILKCTTKEVLRENSTWFVIPLNRARSCRLFCSDYFIQNAMKITRTILIHNTTAISSCARFLVDKSQRSPYCLVRRERTNPIASVVPRLGSAKKRQRGPIGVCVGQSHLGTLGLAISWRNKGWMRGWSERISRCFVSHKL